MPASAMPVAPTCAPGGGALGRLASVDLSGLPTVLGEVPLTVASDVTNPLLGERGAAATYGPQKGAQPDEVAELDRNLRRYADLWKAASAGRCATRPAPGPPAAPPSGCWPSPIASPPSRCDRASTWSWS